MYRHKYTYNISYINKIENRLNRHYDNNIIYAKNEISLYIIFIQFYQNVFKWFTDSK